jgi:hypothetical protein
LEQKTRLRHNSIRVNRLPPCLCKSCRTDFCFCRRLLRTTTCPFRHLRLFLAENKSSAKVIAGLHRFLVPSLSRTPSLSGDERDPGDNQGVRATSGRDRSIVGLLQKKKRRACTRMPVLYKRTALGERHRRAGEPVSRLTEPWVKRDADDAASRTPTLWGEDASRGMQWGCATMCTAEARSPRTSPDRWGFCLLTRAGVSADADEVT